MKKLLVNCQGSGNRKSLGAARTVARQAIVTFSFVGGGLTVYTQDAPEMPEVKSPFTL